MKKNARAPRCAAQSMQPNTTQPNATQPNATKEQGRVTQMMTTEERLVLYEMVEMVRDAVEDDSGEFGVAVFENDPWCIKARALIGKTAELERAIARDEYEKALVALEQKYWFGLRWSRLDGGMVITDISDEDKRFGKDKARARAAAKAKAEAEAGDGAGQEGDGAGQANGEADGDAS